jgi:hypothetical protein
LGAFASNATAADYYWRANDTSSTWNILSKWNTQASGTGGTSPGSFSPTDTYIATNVGANVLNTDFLNNTGTNSVFLGGTLVLATGGQLNLRTVGTSKAQIGNFVTTGGGLIAAAYLSSSVNLTVDSFNNQAGDTRLSASSNANNRTLNLEIGTLFGAGNFTVDSASGSSRTIFISATNATNYTGNFNFAQGTINFNNNLVSGGSLTLSGTAIVTLDQNITFASVTIAGTTLEEQRFYSFTELNTSFGNFFTDGGSGGITVGAVPEPSTYAVIAGASLLGFAVWRRRRHG